MLRFWLFGAIISTATINAIYIGNGTCIGKCDSTSTNIQYLPHMECNKFCVCVSDQPQVFYCDLNYHWSQELEICAHPIEAKCVRLLTESNGTLIITDDRCIESCPELEDLSHTVYLAHRHCNKYCHCKKDYPIIKSCSSNFLFSLKDMRCRQQTDVDCNRVNSTSTVIIPPSDEAIKEGCRTQCPRYNALIPHKKKSKFCLCRNREVIVFECPKRYYFNYDHAKCIYESSSKRSELTTSSFTTLFVPISTADLILSTTLPTTAEPFVISTEPLPPSTVGIIETFNNCMETCPTSDLDDYGVYEFYNVSHKECNKYCECYKGNIIKVVECPTNKKFDVFFRKCESPTFADCYSSDRFNSFTTLLSTSSTESPLTTWPSDDVNCLKNCSELALYQYHIVVNLPHKKCNKYCECYRGETTVKECELTYRFDWIQRECTIAENATCLNHTISMTTLSSLSTSSFEESFNTFSSKVIDDCVEACPRDDSVNFDEYIKIPHSDCKKYCECHRGIVTVIECPYNSYYDCYFQTCDVLKYATCYAEYANSTTPVPHNSSDSSLEITENCIGKCSEVSKMNYAIFLKHKQCQKFCECFGGRLTVKSCPVNSYFNSNLGLCDQAKYVECQDANETSIIPLTASLDTSDCLGVCISDDVYLISHKHCAKYCRCDLGYLEVESCPSNTYFNGYTKRCEDTEYDDCTKIPEIAITLLSEYVEGCVEECPDIVDDSSMVFIPHQQCEKYCLCGMWEKPLVMSCGPNSHFNPIRKECDYIENAGCEGISFINSTFSSHVISLQLVNCTDCDDKKKAHTILLKITGIKNGSEIDLKVGNPDEVDSDSNSNNDDAGELQEFDKYFDNIRIFGEDPNGLVAILANLEEVEQCIGECPEPFSDTSTIYLTNKNCRRACKCRIFGIHVMECHNNYYWNPETEMCEPEIYDGCTEVEDSIENDEPTNDDGPFRELRKFMGW